MKISTIMKISSVALAAALVAAAFVVPVARAAPYAGLAHACGDIPFSAMASGAPATAAPTTLEAAPGR